MLSVPSWIQTINKLVGCPQTHRPKKTRQNKSRRQVKSEDERTESNNSKLQQSRNAQGDDPSGHALSSSHAPCQGRIVSSKKIQA